MYVRRCYETFLTSDIECNPDGIITAADNTIAAVKTIDPDIICFSSNFVFLFVYKVVWCVGL